MMKLLPEISLFVAVISGFAYLLEYKSQTGADYALKWVSIALMIISLVVGIGIFLLDQEKKSKNT